MLLNITNANYIKDFQIRLHFNNGVEKIIDFEPVLEKETFSIFQPLKNNEYFKNFSIKFNTIVWPNEADFAPEFLIEL